MPAPTFDAHRNFAITTIAVPPSPSTTGTSLTVTAGDGAIFPTVPFNASILPVGVRPTPAVAEIVRVTARSGDVFTIARVQEGSAARAIIAGDLIAATITAKAVQDVEGAFTGVARTDTSNTYAGNVIQTFQFDGSGNAQLILSDPTRLADHRIFALTLSSEYLYLQPWTDNFTPSNAL